MIQQAHDSTEPSSVDTASRERWLAQVEGTRAGRRCGCGGCPSIELEDAADNTPSGDTTRVVLSAGTPACMLLLFIDDDHLSYLELAPNEPDARIDEFPAVDLIDFTPSG